MFYEMMLIDCILFSADSEPLLLYVGDAHAKSVSSKRKELPGWIQLTELRLIENKNSYTNSPQIIPIVISSRSSACTSAVIAYRRK